MWSQRLWKRQSNTSSFRSLPLLSPYRVFLCQFKCLGLCLLDFSLVCLFVSLLEILLSWPFTLSGFCGVDSRKCKGQSGWFQTASVCHPTWPVHLSCHKQAQQNFWSRKSSSNHQHFRYVGKEEAINFFSLSCYGRGKGCGILWWKRGSFGELIVCGGLNLSTSTSSTRLFPHILLHFGDGHSCHFLNVWSSLVLRVPEAHLVSSSIWRKSWPWPSVGII